MENLKKIALLLPEYFLILAVVFYWWSTTPINPIAICLILVLIFQIVFKNQITGIIIPSVLMLVFFYLIFALMSEFNEFSTFNSDAKIMLFVGLSYLISSIMISGIMIYKYSTMEIQNNKELDI